MAVLIKRYANRKLYNTDTSRYITLKGIAQLIEAGQEVRVVDNESGEDITSVTLSQILVDSERSNRSVPGNLLSELIQRSGEAVMGALRKGVDEATEGIEELRTNVRKVLSGREREGGRIADWIAVSAPDLDRMVHSTMERVFKALDLPRRQEIDALREKLDEVARALEARGSGHATEPAPRPPGNGREDSNARG